MLPLLAVVQFAQGAGYISSTDSNGVATITLDRPKRLNALTFEVYRELTDLFAQLERRPEVSSVVITGEGAASARVAT